MAGESVDENIYLAITFGYGGQKSFSQTATCHSRALAAISQNYIACYYLIGFRMTKKYKYTIFGIANLLFFIFYFLVWRPNVDNENRAYEFCIEWKDKVISGKIESIQDSRIIYYTSSDGEKVSLFPHCNYVDIKISIGDSVYKPAASFDLYLYSKANIDSLTILACDFNCDKLSSI